MSFVFENHSMLLIAACFITETCPSKMQRFSSAVKIENFTGFFYNFNNFVQNIDCGYTLEPPCRGGSNDYLLSMFWIKNKKNSIAL